MFIKWIAHFCYFPFVSFYSRSPESNAQPTRTLPEHSRDASCMYTSHWQLQLTSWTTKSGIDGIISEYEIREWRLFKWHKRHATASAESDSDMCEKLHNVKWHRCCVQVISASCLCLSFQTVLFFSVLFVSLLLLLLVLSYCDYLAVTIY